MTRIPMTRIVSLVAACVTTLGAGACNQLERTGDGGNGAQIPDEVQRAFDDSCATVGCHDSTTRAQGLDLTHNSSASIIGGSASESSLPLVELGNVEGSYLAIKILEEMPPSGTRMPPTRPPGPDEAIIVGWIAGVPLPGGGDGGSEGTTTAAEGSGSGGGSGESTGGSSVKACGLADIQPSAANPYDIGTAAGQIPEDVGAVLVDNCGCHELDDTTGVPYPYLGMVHFSTIAEIQADNAMGIPVYEEIQGRVDGAGPIMPPLGFCDVGDGTTITAADKQLLVDWLSAGAPDAANWP